MSEQTIDQQILNCEKRYWQAMQEQDLDTLLELTDFPCMVVSPHGQMLVDQEQYIRMFKSNEGMIKSFSLDDSSFQVRQINPETSIVAYRANCKFEKEGKILESNAIDTSTWIKKGNKWVCSLHTETELMKH